MTAKLPLNLFRNEPAGNGLPQDALLRYQAEFTLNSVAPQQHSVFPVDEAILRPPTEKRSHWSIAWSDLMMTMFILFLSLFVYQAAHREYLMSDTSEVVAGATRTALDVERRDPVGVPFVPIEPGAPLLTAGTVKKVEPVTLQEIDLDEVFSGVDSDKTVDQLAQTAAPAPPEQKSVPSGPEDIPADAGTVAAADLGLKRIAPANPVAIPDTVLQPQPLATETTSVATVKELFDEGRKTLTANNLDEFAAIDLVADKAVRIVLTGDLLFETGHAALSAEAIRSLEKIAEVVRKTPHRIHIEGHTDNVPIASGRYANNWELSVARANAVANFLIEDMGMDPEQFVVSGYASYKPVAPNITAANRAANRRVEIVIAKPGEQQQIAATHNSSNASQTL